MLPSATKSPEHLAAVGRVKDWTRERFALPAGAAIMVAEVRCRLPGCAPLETVVAFWSVPDTRHRFKVFKPVGEVARDDLPPRWFLNALVDDGELACECC